MSSDSASTFAAASAAASAARLQPPPPRKGAIRRADVSSRVLRELNAGRDETRTLAEFLVVDLEKLMRSVLPACGLGSALPRILRGFRPYRDAGIMERLRRIGELLAHDPDVDVPAITRLSVHRSDVVRECAALAHGANPGLTLKRRLALARPFARDHNMGVREIAWMSVRDAIATDLDRALVLLVPWTGHRDLRVRRFASEVTRPRGVWCSHIEALKRDPSLGLVILEPLRADPSRYVQDSVANWLNDASKSHPEWVRTVTARWLAESDTVETRRIVKRALRTVTKRDAR